MPPRPYQDQRSGKWRGQVPLPNGRRVSKTFNTKREANAWIVRTLNEIQQGVDPTPQQITVAQFLERWLADVARMKCRPKTIEGYEGVVRVHIVPAIGALKLADLRGDHVQHVCTVVLEAGDAPSTARHVYAVLRSALTWAVRWKLIARNPAGDAQPPRRSRGDMHVFTPEQARCFLAGVAPHRWHLLYLLAIVTGMRQGEIIGLHWVDVDVDNAVLRVTTSAGPIAGRGVVMSEPKTAASRRQIPLTAELAAAFKAHRRAQLAQRLRTVGWEDHGLVFCTGLGRPLNRVNVTRHFHRACSVLGLPSLRFHDLRHTAATLMLRSGVHPRVVQSILGHEDISVTLGVYSEYSPDMGADAIERVQGLLGR